MSGKPQVTTSPPSKTVADIVQKARIPLVVADLTVADAPLCQVNDAFADLTGYDEQEIIGRNCRFLQGEQPAPAAQRDDIKRAIDGFQESRGMLLNFRVDGSAFANFLFLFPLTEPVTNRRLMLGSQFDVTPHISRNLVNERLHELIDVAGPFLSGANGDVLLNNFTIFSRSIHAQIEAGFLREDIERRLEFSEK